MKSNTLLAIKFSVLLIFAQTAVFAQNSKEIFINPNSGKDQNAGTKESPLKSLSEAAKKVNISEGKGIRPVVIIFSCNRVLPEQNWEQDFL